MSHNGAWLVDLIAAENISRDLCLQLSEDQIALLSSHMAEHRRDAVELTGSRLLSNALESIRELIVGQQNFRSVEWSNGCRSAEEAVVKAMSRTMLEIAPPKAVSRGSILRSRIEHARRNAKLNALTIRHR
jgi:hypothetical protein